MIKIRENNKFKIIDGTKINDLTKENNTLLNKFKCFYNTALNGVWCHNKSFGTKADYEFGTDTGMTSQFYIDEGYLCLSCYGHGGMSSFMFDESNIKTAKEKEDVECMRYTVSFLNTLHEEGIIENPHK
ncbi:hypothetical protein [Abyssicoccus albus]|uniref:hypothetical protein n=1 Tax=Abyssicoccus albus TaxID=1817405 RepID=UPI00097E3FFD|nr:hypothetical protein [Abyssicoccus albus]AQL56431.1 hypothetical protein BVH56_05605 [Abyssicoccus albus]